MTSVRNKVVAGVGEDAAPAFTDAELQGAVDAAYAAALPNKDGKVASYIPELARADPEALAVAVCTPDGRVFTAGDALAEFTAQSASKPFLYGTALKRHGEPAVRAVVGVEPTGDAFNSLVRLESGTGRPHNPMVNAGAIAVASLLAARDGSRRVTNLLDIFRDFAGRDDISVDMGVFLSERASGDRNRALAHLMQYFGTLASPVNEALELYFQACSVLLTTTDLAVMAAALANDAKQPMTGEVLLDHRCLRDVLTIMSTCGLYNSTGRFMFDAGIPAKSGVSGCVFAVAPGRLGIAAYSPRLDAWANSVRGVAAVKFISERLKLHVFETPPASGVTAVEAASAAPKPSKPMSRRMRAVQDPSLSTVLEKVLVSAREELATGGKAIGVPAQYLAELGTTDVESFALAVCTADGREATAGDAGARFTIQAAANPFAYALALKARGAEAVAKVVGVEPSGNPFNAIVLDPDTNRPSNPLGNAGAIAVAGMQPGAGAAERLNGLMAGMAAFAGVKRLNVDAAVLEAETRGGERNRAIAYLLRNFGAIDDVEAALELYFQQCSLEMTPTALARMGATLARGGVNPMTAERVIPAELVRPVLSVMYTTGMHDSSGQFAFDAGIPAKSGVSGCIVAVVPGRMGIAVYQPRVDAHGASVAGLVAMRHLAEKLDAGLFG
jgi:glutaminase